MKKAFTKDFWNWRTRIGNVTVHWPSVIVILSTWVLMWLIWYATS